MVIVLTKKATSEQLKKMGHEYDNYIKVVVDIEKGILAGGAAFHYEEEGVLLEYSSKQSNLWGGGIDLKTEEIDYNSMINVRPNQDNPSRDVLDTKIREKFDIIVKEIFL